MLFYSFLSAALLNGVLALQMGIYWNARNDKKEKEGDRLTSGVREKKIGLERVEVEKIVDTRPAMVRKLD